MPSSLELKGHFKVSHEKKLSTIGIDTTHHLIFWRNKRSLRRLSPLVVEEIARAELAKRGPWSIDRLTQTFEHVLSLAGCAIREDDVARHEDEG